MQLNLALVTLRCKTGFSLEFPNHGCHKYLPEHASSINNLPQTSSLLWPSTPKVACSARGEQPARGKEGFNLDERDTHLAGSAGNWGVRA